jgi:hypothetical protein
MVKPQLFMVKPQIEMVYLPGDLSIWVQPLNVKHIALHQLSEHKSTLSHSQALMFS